MPVSIPDSHQRLLKEPVIASLATVMPDGRPQVNPVWCDYDGTYVRINSAAGRQKDKNLRKRQYATILLVDPADPYFWLEIRGHVAEITTEGADAHIDRLSKKYTDQEVYANHRADETRVTYKIEPDRVRAWGE